MKGKSRTGAAGAVVFVGFRGDALVAAGRLGVPICLVSEAPPPRKQSIGLAASFQTDFGATDPRHWEALADRLAAAGAYRVVLALTERAVYPAALLRDRLGLPGQSTTEALACIDKASMKAQITGAGLRCASLVRDDEGLDATRIIERLGLPIFLKTRRGSGGRGAQLLRSAAAVPPALRHGWMAEAFVEGVEMSVESFVDGGRPVFTNFTEYVEPGWSNLVPAGVEACERAALLDVNRRAITALGIERGITHMEVFLTDDGVVFGELAARPPGGHIMSLLQLVYGFDPWEAWLRLELDHAVPGRPEPTGFAGVRLFHPGPGVLRRITGLEDLRNLPGCVRLRFRLREGDRITERIGVGQEVGHVVFAAPERAIVTEGLERARTSVRLEVDAIGPQPDTDDPRRTTVT